MRFILHRLAFIVLIFFILVTFILHVQYIQRGLDGANMGSVPISCARVEISDLKVRESTIKELNSVEASLRVDALAAAGFRLSEPSSRQIYVFNCFSHVFVCSFF